MPSACYERARLKRLARTCLCNGSFPKSQVISLPVEIPLSVRSIIKYGCVYKYINENDKEKIYNCFGTLATSKKAFYEIYDKLFYNYDI